MVNNDSWSLKMTVPLEMGIVCNNMEKMLDFYVGVLGLQPVGDATAAEEGSTKMGATPHGFRIVRLQTPYGERVKLAQPLKDAPQTHALPQWAMEHHGFAYLTFVIADMKEIVKRLKEKGVKTMNSAPVESHPGVLVLMSVDPENNFVEFVEYPDPAAYRSDLFKK